MPVGQMSYHRVLEISLNWGLDSSVIRKQAEKACLESNLQSSRKSGTKNTVLLDKIDILFWFLEKFKLDLNMMLSNYLQIFIKIKK